MKIAILLAVIAAFACPGTASANALSSLDQFCGGALSNSDCLKTMAAYPLETGAVVAIIEAEKSHFANAEDCQKKLTLGSASFAKITPYVSNVGGDVLQIVKAGCIIVFSTTTCSGEAKKFANDAADVVAWAFHKLSEVLGIDDSPGGGETQEQMEANYWASVYAPMEPPMIGVPEAVYLKTAGQLDEKCTSEWWHTNVNLEAVCTKGFTKRFKTDVNALRAEYQAYLKGQAEVAQAQMDAALAEAAKQAEAQAKLRAAQDAATDNARKIAMSWAKIKQGAYAKDCHDKKCIDEVTGTAIFYYGALATGMQKMDSSNTQVLANTNATFEPIFKQHIASDNARAISRLSLAASSLAPRLERLTRVQDIRAATRAKLFELGVRDGDAVLHRAYWLRTHRIPLPGRAQGTRG